MANPPSSLLIRLLDRSKNLDYLFSFIIGAWPIVFSILIGADQNISFQKDGHTDHYLGYCHQANWWSLAILFPVILYAFRWVMGKIANVICATMPIELPPIINICGDQSASPLVYQQLRKSLLSKVNVYLALIVVIIIHVLDMWPLLVTYATDAPYRFYNWASFFLLPAAGIEKPINLLLVFFAYSVQFSVAFLGVLTIILIFRHNCFFMRNVYQRHSEPVENSQIRFHIDINDINRCFGFRIANEAFNTQIKALMIAGAAMFISRFMNSENSDSIEFLIWRLDLPSFSFPLAGQWLMAVAWLLALAIVAMPAFVKLLPLFRKGNGQDAGLTIESYLHEFFSAETWPKDRSGKAESLTVVANKFARNSFWPTGDNRAGTLFHFSYWIFLVILLPPSFNIVTLLTTLTVYGVLAYLLKKATFKGLRWALSYVDDMLVNTRTDRLPEESEAEAESQVSVFISYRRSDSAPYARSIHQFLKLHLQDKNIFMDIEAIEPGVKFGQEIQSALAKVNAVIVLIGKEWERVADMDGKPRIHNPDDMVRFEIETALALGKRIFPVLVNGAKMPEAAALPDSLKELAQINALEVSDQRWDYDLGILADALKTAG